MIMKVKETFLTHIPGTRKMRISNCLRKSIGAKVRASSKRSLEVKQPKATRDRSSIIFKSEFQLGRARSPTRGKDQMILRNKIRD